MASETFPVEKSEKEWREVLSADQFRCWFGKTAAGRPPFFFAATSCDAPGDNPVALTPRSANCRCTVRIPPGGVP